MFDKSVKLYKEASVENSMLGHNSTIGDFSRVRDSHIGSYCRIDRQNFC